MPFKSLHGKVSCISKWMLQRHKIVRCDILWILKADIVMKPLCSIPFREGSHLTLFVWQSVIPIGLLPAKRVYSALQQRVDRDSENDSVGYVLLAFQSCENVG